MKFKTELRAKAQIQSMSTEDMPEGFSIMRAAEINTYKPTPDMIQEAEKGLKWRKEFGKGGTKIGVAKARSITSGSELSFNTVKRMHAFFNRHESDVELDNFANEDTPSQERIAWALWGGDSGRAWAKRIIEKSESLAKATHHDEKEMAELDPDLLKMKSILVSQGINLNDDVFLKEELVRARFTGANKPVNIEHQDTDIIGHMLATYAVNKDGEKLEDMEDLELESEIDIVNEAVIYAYIFPDVAMTIQELASANDLFVSVEAWFSAYDYMLGDQIIERNESTASVLEKHLRINGGEGFYQDRKVGRVLRNIMFGGVGVVATPANPRSFILQVGDVENAKISEDVVLASHVIGNVEELNDLREAVKEEDMADKENLDLSSEKAESDLQEQHVEAESSDEQVSSVDASNDDSTETEEVVEASSQEDADNETEASTEESEVSIDASSDEKIEAEATVEDLETEDSEGTAEDIDASDETQAVEAADAEAETTETEEVEVEKVEAEADERIVQLEKALSSLAEGFTKQAETIKALEEKVVLLETEATIVTRKGVLAEAGLSEEAILARIDKFTQLSSDDFDSYVDDIKDLIKASDDNTEVEDTQEESTEDKTTASEEIVEQEVEINLDEVEPDSTEISAEENSPVDNSVTAKFATVFQDMFSTRANKRR